MAVEYERVFVGELLLTALSRSLSLDVSKWSAGTFQYESRYGVTVGSWSCSIKRAVGASTPQAFPTALTFTSAVVVQPATNAADLSGTDRIVFTTDVVGTAGTVDIWAILKS